MISKQDYAHKVSTLWAERMLKRLKGYRLIDDLHTVKDNEATSIRFKNGGVTIEIQVKAVDR